jgi:cell division protein FtsB
MHRLKQAVLPTLLLLAVYYAVFGGEYSWFDLRTTRAAVEQEEAELAELHRQIDSLRAWADSLQVDSVTLERIAREQFGLVRPGEVLYRFVETGDSISLPIDSTGLTAR